MTDISATLEPASGKIPTDHVSSVTARRPRTVIARLEETAGLAGRAVGLTHPDR